MWEKVIGDSGDFMCLSLRHLYVLNLYFNLF